MSRQHSRRRALRPAPISAPPAAPALGVLSLVIKDSMEAAMRPLLQAAVDQQCQARLTATMARARRLEALTLQYPELLAGYVPPASLQQAPPADRLEWWVKQLEARARELGLLNELDQIGTEAPPAAREWRNA